VFTTGAGPRKQKQSKSSVTAPPGARPWVLFSRPNLAPQQVRLRGRFPFFPSKTGHLANLKIVHLADVSIRDLCYPLLLLAGLLVVVSKNRLQFLHWDDKVKCQRNHVRKAGE
jgi:hypothetical protein